MTRLHAFSCALCQLHVITSSFDWFSGLSESFVIGCSDWQSDYFGFGLENRSNWSKNLAPISDPFRSKTKTSNNVLKHTPVLCFSYMYFGLLALK